MFDIQFCDMPEENGFVVTIHIARLNAEAEQRHEFFPYSDRPKREAFRLAQQYARGAHEALRIASRLMSASSNLGQSLAMWNDIVKAEKGTST